LDRCVVRHRYAFRIRSCIARRLGSWLEFPARTFEPPPGTRGVASIDRLPYVWQRSGRPDAGDDVRFFRSPIQCATGRPSWKVIRRGRDHAMWVCRYAPVTWP